MKRLPFLILAAMLLAFSGCENASKDEAEYIYYLRYTENGYLWAKKEFTPKEEELNDRCLEVLEALRQPPEGMRAALPAEVAVRSVRVVGNVIYVDFSAEYVQLSAGERSIACAAVVHSLLQTEGLHYVSVTAEGEPQSPTYERYCTLSTFILE